MTESDPGNQSFLSRIINWRWGKSKKNQECLLKISFYNEDVEYGTHGYLMAKCPQRGVHKPCSVRFVFVGISAPPALTPEIYNKIFTEAANAGFVVDHLESYGMRSRTPIVANVNMMLSESRVTAEDGAHRREEHYSRLAQAHFQLPSTVQAPPPSKQKQNKGTEHGLVI